MPSRRRCSARKTPREDRAPFRSGLDGAPSQDSIQLYQEPISTDRDPTRQSALVSALTTCTSHTDPTIVIYGLTISIKWILFLLPFPRLNAHLVIVRSAHS